MPFESLSTGSVVVTGGARGIGAAIATTLAQLGSEVTVLDPAPAVSADRICCLRGSAAVDADCARAAAQAAERAPLIGWVNTAVVYDDAALSAGTDRFTAAVQANLVPVIAGSSAAIAAFRAAGTGGSIVNFSSHQAQRPVAGAAAYATAKGAVEAFTRATAVDHGSVGIRANAVAPGSVMTERHRAFVDGLDPASAQRVTTALCAVHPLRRLGEVHEVAATVAFLLADESSFISGAVLPVDGGRAVLGMDPEARGDRGELDHDA